MRSLLLLLLVGLVQVASAFEWIKNFGNWKFGGGGGDDQADDVTDQEADDLPSNITAEARRDIFFPEYAYPIRYQNPCFSRALSLAIAGTADGATSTLAGFKTTATTPLGGELVMEKFVENK